MEKKVQSLAALLVCGISISVQSAVLVTDPGGLDSPINSLNVPISAEIGNMSLATMNGSHGPNIIRQTLTFDTVDGYPTTEASNPVPFNTARDRSIITPRRIVTFENTGANFLHLSSGGSHQSSGNQALIAHGDAHITTVSFDEPVLFIGFTANRVLEELTVRIFADLAKTSQIGSDFTIAPNTHSFFGFRSDSENILAFEVQKMSDGNQYGLDDITFGVVIPEPSTALLLLIAPLILRAMRRRLV